MKAARTENKITVPAKQKSGERRWQPSWQAKQETARRQRRGPERAAQGHTRRRPPPTPPPGGRRPGSVPVAAVRGPRRNPVDADVRLHTQHRLIFQLGRHLGSASAAGAGHRRGRAELPDRLPLRHFRSSLALRFTSGRR